MFARIIKVLYFVFLYQTGIPIQVMISCLIVNFSHIISSLFQRFYLFVQWASFILSKWEELTKSLQPMVHTWGYFNSAISIESQFYFWFIRLQSGQTTAIIRPRNWRLSASWGPIEVTSWNPSHYHSTIVLKGLRRAFNYAERRQYFEQWMQVFLVRPFHRSKHDY